MLIITDENVHHYRSLCNCFPLEAGFPRFNGTCKLAKLNLWFEGNFRSAFRNLIISTVPITSTLNFQICTPISPAWFKFAFLMKSPGRVICVHISRLNLLASAWLHDFEIADRLGFFCSNQKSVYGSCGNTFWVTNRCDLIKHSKSKRDHPKADGASASKKRDHELGSETRSRHQNFNLRSIVSPRHRHKKFSIKREKVMNGKEISSGFSGEQWRRCEIVKQLIAGWVN